MIAIATTMMLLLGWGRECTETASGVHTCAVFDATTPDHADVLHGESLHFVFPSTYTVDDANGWSCSRKSCTFVIPAGWGYSPSIPVPLPAMTCPDSPATCPNDDGTDVVESVVEICLGWLLPEGGMTGCDD